MRPVDRVVIRSGENGAVGPGLKVLFDHTDREAIQHLVDLFKPTEIDGHCLCLGDALVEFYHGEEFAFSFTVHHNLLLRGDGIAWGDDLQFEPDAIERFLRGFATIGYSGFADAIDAQHRQSAEADARWEALLALFPIDARPYLPRGRSLAELTQPNS